MPFKSETQRRWMHANKPGMAKRWEDHTPDDRELPEKVSSRIATAVIEKTGARKKPYRNRVDVFALDSKNRLYSGVYPDGSIGPFGGGVDHGETVLQAAKREFLEESGRRIRNPQRIAISNFEESRLARQGWRNAGKHDRVKQYGGTRSFAVLADLVKGKKVSLSEPADHIKKVKFRTLPEAITTQQKAVTGAQKGRKGVLKHRLNALKHIASLRGKTASVIVDRVLVKIANEMESPVTPTLLGGGLGGVAAHSLFPTEATKAYRELSGAIQPGSADVGTVSDVTQGGKKVRFQAPAQARRRYFLDRALQSNARRLAKGIGLGLLGGYGVHRLLEKE